MRRHHAPGRFLAAAALVAAAVGVGTPAPAVAAGCSSASGVTVVVDFNQLGGGVSSGCVSGGGGQKASALFPSAGHPLTYAQRQPGFVCRVSGVPAEDPCINTSPASAYWGLWWTDGEGGAWVYSSLGASSLTIPDGGYVAFSWDESGGDAEPSYTPAAHAEPSPTPAPTPTAEPSQPPAGDGGGGGTGGGTSGGSTGSASGPAPTGAPASGSTSPGASSASPSASPTGEPDEPGEPGEPGESGTPTASGDPSTSTAPSASPSDDPADESTDVPFSDDPVSPTAADADDDGLPAYVAPALIVVLFTVAGVVFLLRRRQTGP
ncbi:hypothetical protein [Nocardioides sp.]|uniref:hypothetical protein n=1 Tax=Nocardioides sp. TaxID=35761 RepID=UPI00286C9F56|nr:hypothetical protein [Nocardioides sp.]